MENAVVPVVVSLLLICVRCATPAPSETFDLGIPMANNVTVSVGQVANLTCHLSKSRNTRIVWIRWHGPDQQSVLTVNDASMFPDHRFSSKRNPDGSRSLIIQNVQLGDADTYRCHAGMTDVLKEDFHLHVKGCKDDEFACGGGQMCIERTRRCDGVTICPDAEDEVSCHPEECKGPSVYCGNGRCVLLDYFCDANDDCGNGFDERNCTSPNVVDCRDGEFLCGSGECVPAPQRCDGIIHCKNAGDEHDCRPTSPGASATTAAPTTESARTSTVDEDGSVPTVRNVTAFVGQDIVLSCPIETDSQVVWFFQKKPSMVSDRGSDGRWQLTIKNVQRENAGMYLCRAPSSPGTFTQILVLHVADTACSSGAGGVNCTSQNQCAKDSWSCGDGTCVSRSWWCDGEQDCATAADERACSTVDCQPETTYCGNGRCEKGARCDGKDDCAKSSNPGFDEANCSADQCARGARYCGNGHCVAAYMICDGVDQCGNGADEKFCGLPFTSAPSLLPLPPPHSTPVPREANGDTGISWRGKEQGAGDLKDLLRALSDSLSAQRRIAVTLWRMCRFQFLLPDRGSCASGKFQCGFDCLAIGKRCNGVADCAGGRDEEDCHVLEEACGPSPV